MVENCNAFATAIYRNKLSKPMKTLLDKELLKGKILDYGCGHGDDVIELVYKKGFDVVGYDKYSYSFNNQYLLHTKYDTVTCNYVFNTIPTKQEHDEVLKLLKTIGNDVYISVRSDKKAIKNNWVYYKDNDGYVTPKNTFQRFYDEEMVHKYFGEVEYIINNNSLKLFKIK